jgi:hypothetical protein
LGKSGRKTIFPTHTLLSATHFGLRALSLPPRVEYRAGRIEKEFLLFLSSKVLSTEVFSPLLFHYCVPTSPSGILPYSPLTIYTNNSIQEFSWQYANALTQNVVQCSFCAVNVLFHQRPRCGRLYLTKGRKLYGIIGIINYKLDNNWAGTAHLFLNLSLK